MSSKKDPIIQSDIHNARGIELAEKGWLDEAVNEFQKAINYDPDSAHAHDNLASVYIEKNQFVEALDSLVTAIKLDPHNPHTYQFLASFLAERSSDVCETLFKKSIEIEPDFIESYIGLGIYFKDKGEIETSIENFEKALQLDSENEMVRHELAILLMEQQKYPEAINQLKAILKEHPDHHEVYVDLGIAYTVQGFYDEAERQFFKALENDKNNVAAKYYLANLYVLTDKNAQALEFLQSALEVNKDLVLNWILEDEVFVNLKDTKEFQELLEKIQKE